MKHVDLDLSELVFRLGVCADTAFQFILGIV